MSVRILCVDDQPTSRQILVRTLSRFLARHFEETRIRAVDSGESAIDFLRGLHRRHSGVDLVLTDLHMPGMSGLELLRQLKQNAHTERVPIVLLSGDALASDDPRFERGRPDLVLTKPIRREDLQNVLTLLVP